MEEGVKKVLSIFIKDTEVVRLICNKNTLKYWKRAFTHESVNYIENYEREEFLGDAVVNYAFIRYLREKQNIQVVSKINTLKTFYMSKNYQPVMAKKIGLDYLLIISPEIKITDDIFEDIFESFFGVFDMIVRKLHSKYPNKIKHPLDYIIDFFDWYFTNVKPLDLSKGDLISKTFLNQLYSLFSDESTQTKFQWYFNEKTGRMVYNKDFLIGISNYSKSLEKEISKVVHSKYINEDEFLENIVSKFKSLGYDLDWLETERKFIAFDKELAKENDYTRFILKRNAKMSYDLIAQKVDPLTRKSISECIHSFDTKNFNKLKIEAEEMLYLKFKK